MTPPFVLRIFGDGCPAAGERIEDAADFDEAFLLANRRLLPGQSLEVRQDDGVLITRFIRDADGGLSQDDDI
ncbi:MAG TPA: hypothetical protein VG125_13715 [Pirellulales bacterium]|jgi:hypothetical protein|nr:hypothetical protein [Pirellulales bacterium]